MKGILEKEISIILENLGVENPQVNFDNPAHIEMGDCSTNVAMFYAKELGKQPIDLAEKIKSHLEARLPSVKIGVVKPGFINFFFDAEHFAENIKKIL
mgnify:CR=1 FL=1